MDLNPLIPNTTTSHDVAHIISESFEDTIKNYILPNDVSESLRKNNVDQEYALFQQFGYEIKEFADIATEKHENLQSVEMKIMKKQGMDLILEKNIEDDVQMKEGILLKRDGFFSSYEFDFKNLNLIDQTDILPNNVEQSLEFVHKKDLHGCKFNHGQEFQKKTEEQPQKYKDMKSKMHDLKIEHKEEFVDEPLKLEPTEILFDDFELNTNYKKKVRLQNCSKRKIPFFFTHPKKSPFSLKPISDVQFLAPGMYVDFYVTYCTKIYHNYSIDIEFSTSGGHKVVLKVKSFRKPPHLRVYLFRSMKHIIQDKCPGTSEFWERRCTALNDTIDCGHCFIGNYNYLSLLIGNVANRGQFFVLTEDEWISGNVNNTDHTMQFTKESFKIFPSYIVVERDEVAEICVTFAPTSSGLHLEKLYLISDNNTAKAIEIIGDGLYFSIKMIQIHLKSRHFEKVANIGEKESLSIEVEGKRCIYLVNVANSSSNKITFTVNNRSAMSFNIYWTFRKNENDPKSLFLESKYIHMKNENHPSLSPYTTYDFDVDIRPEVDQEGHYSFIMGFYIEKIPENALEEGEEFIVRIDEKDMKFLDIQLSELEIGCEIYFENVKEEIEELLPEKCTCPKSIGSKEMNKVQFSHEMLDFGVITIGIEISRKMCICNMTTEKVEWTIKEIIYDIDKRPSMYVARNPSIDDSSGTLTGPKYSLQYYIDAKKPTRWVSMLLLFTRRHNGDLDLNDICIVTYEVVDWDIRIYSDVSSFPIICALKLHYVGENYQWKFFIKNFTPIMGCFWLLPPVGEDSGKMALRFHPKCGLIRPGEKIKVIVDVVPKETGIIENIVVPCFISKSREPIMIKVLAAIDDVNVYFYIPSQAEGYDKILWPPKVLNEVDFQQLKSAERLCGEFTEENDYVCNSDSEAKYANFETELMPDNQSDLQSYKSDDDPTNPTIDSDVPSSSSNSRIVSLVEFLRERCNQDFMKQDYVVEMRNVSLNRPEKFSFFIENVTPVEAKFLIETTNFHPCIDLEDNMVNALTLIYPETIYSTWEKACGKHGIVIAVDLEKGTLKCADVIQINVWVYATTWGIYTEEIVVNINDITPFYFNIFVEVNGPPVSFPIARNTIREYATLRFGHIPYMTDIVTRTLHLKNTSCIPLIIQWFLFDAGQNDETQPFNVILDMIKDDLRNSDGEIRLFLSNKSYGEQKVNFMQVLPSCVELDPYERSSVDVIMNPNHFPVNFKATNITCFLVGYIFVKEEHKNQPNLVYRLSAEELKPLHVEILASIVMPLLKLELICGKPKIYKNATEIVEGKKQCERMKMSFQNSNLTSVFVNFHVDAPFYIVNISMREYGFEKNNNNAVIKPGDVLQIDLNCLLESDHVIQMGNWLYNNDTAEREQVSLEAKTISLCRHLNIHQRGVLEQSLPIYCEISYPRIEVNPPFLKFEHVKIGSTKKLYLQLYNMTKVDIDFEIEKSINLPQFTIKPETGVIPKAVGLTRSFFDICVHFTPILYNFYQESILIKTKIPQCYLEVPMNGYGIQNEKFDVDCLTFQP